MSSPGKQWGLAMAFNTSLLQLIHVSVWLMCCCSLTLTEHCSLYCDLDLAFQPGAPCTDREIQKVTQQRKIEKKLNFIQMSSGAERATTKDHAPSL